MPDKYIIQRRTASGLETVAELPALESGKIDLSWLPVVGESGAAIIARGSNANGEWVRWEDGTQVCLQKVTTSLTDNSTGIGKTATFPAAFFSAPVVAAMPRGIASSSNTSVVVVELGAVSASSCNVKVTIVIEENLPFSPGNGIEVHVLAIGRWK